MPAGNVEPVESHRFQASDSILLDTNVWLFLQGPLPLSQEGRAARYQTAFKKMLTAGCRPYLDSMVLAEFINRCARFYYEKLPSNRKPRWFKEFRGTSDYRACAVDIAARARGIVKQSVRIEGRFEKLDISSELDTFAKGMTDFNDQLLIDLCRARNLSLMTDDSDFRGAPIQLLTANPGLLR